MVSQTAGVGGMLVGQNSCGRYAGRANSWGG